MVQCIPCTRWLVFAYKSDSNLTKKIQKNFAKQNFKNIEIFNIKKVNLNSGVILTVGYIDGCGIIKQDYPNIQ